MARRRSKRFGAVTGRKLWADGWGKGLKFNVQVWVQRGSNGYVANACPKTMKGRNFDRRCGNGKGRSATAASAAALRSMASKLK